MNLPTSQRMITSDIQGSNSTCSAFVLLAVVMFYLQAKTTQTEEEDATQKDEEQNIISNVKTRMMTIMRMNAKGKFFAELLQSSYSEATRYNNGLSTTTRGWHQTAVQNPVRNGAHRLFHRMQRAGEISQYDKFQQFLSAALRSYDFSTGYLLTEDDNKQLHPIHFYDDDLEEWLRDLVKRFVSAASDKLGE